ncbi:DciA family protein [Nocardia asteroides]|uniref:DciA family protein n=1 Tax=Nocardia asteroides TaxID=1824 RepID=UPI0037C6F890
MKYTRKHGCDNGWRGFDSQHRPIPCLSCRPHLVTTAQVNDCGDTEQPLRRHPVQDQWVDAVTAELGDSVEDLDVKAMPLPVELDEGVLRVQSTSTPWLQAVSCNSDGIAHRINSRLGDDVVNSIVVTLPGAAA